MFCACIHFSRTIFPSKWRFVSSIVLTVLLTLSFDKLVVVPILKNMETSCPSHHGQLPIDLLELPAEWMTGQEIYQYLRWTNGDSCKFKADFGFYVFPDGIHSAPDGQKSVCLDQNVGPVFGNCLVYSFGIGNMWSFDESMDDFGCEVYSFDPSMAIDDHDTSRRIYFYKWGLDGEDRIHPTEKWPMKTAPSIYEKLSELHGHRIIDVLKMDVEFAEWDAIPQMMKSRFLADKVKQLAVEIHFRPDDSLETYRHRIAILQDLESDCLSSDGRIGRFVRFTSRLNPWLRRPIDILNGREEYIGFEVTWYNSRFYNASAFWLSIRIECV